METVDIGATGAKAEADGGQLLNIMRRVMAAHPDAGPSEWVRLWVLELDNHDDSEDLNRSARRYCGFNLVSRCMPRTRQTRTRASRPEVEAKKVIIQAQVRLWVWKLPTNGLPLNDCTFAEVAEAAPMAGRFLRELAKQGAPGQKVRDVFKNGTDLKEFWNKNQ